MDHSVFTIVAPVLARHEDQLRLVLHEIGQDPGDNAVLPLRAVPGLHFSSLTLHEHAPKAFELIFELNVDGAIDDHLPGLVKSVRAGLDAVLGHCRDWPTGTDDAVTAYLRAHVVEAGAFHVGNTGRTVERIRQEAALGVELQAHLDHLRDAGDLPTRPTEIRDALLAYVDAHPDLAWVRSDPGPNLTPDEVKARRRDKLTFIATVAGAAVVALPLTLVGAGWLLLKECIDAPDDRDADPELVQWLEAMEDQPGYVQNHLTSIVDIKPGPVRHHVLRLVLRAINTLARVDFVHGTLGGISSIHFAHWSIIDGGERLLFVSNFDGSWESYLDDFIELAHVGLTAVWSNGAGFPRTHFLITEGATHGLQFKNWARRSQQVTDVWYSAYPALGVTAIDNNSAIRAGLAGAPQEGIPAWVRRL